MVAEGNDDEKVPSTCCCKLLSCGSDRYTGRGGRLAKYVWYDIFLGVVATGIVCYSYFQNGIVELEDDDLVALHPLTRQTMFWTKVRTNPSSSSLSFPLFALN